ncbi:DUF4012 domain-containing protein [Nocardioides sp.]|uniref:DUF4012 domain-containing protein n=1 Tax=Nocardioides sp. TaxID=35761 RepID=UPI002735DB28|nr:DUF4012 domain-containing protein [Nocardioides sp.]MDP3893776.1 DUF4012 domain-containing protein [Nocardioides sp.]
MSRRRLLTALLILAVLGAVGYTAWLGWSVQRDLRQAQASATRLQSAVTDRDEERARSAADDLRRHSAAAAERTDGPWWGALTQLPFVGDDAEGIRVLSSSLELISSDGMDPLLEVVDLIADVNDGGRIDVDVVRALKEPVVAGHASVALAASRLEALDSSGFVRILRERYDELAEVVSGLDEGLGAAAEVAEVLPAMVGGEGRRTYLMAFQNNAEVRSTGGMPGVFAVVTAEDGKLTLSDQVTASSFGELDRPILPLTGEERAFFGPQLGTYIQDANFVPHFPRTAELMAARWTDRFGGELDGVVTIDTVGMSYLLPGTGPVTTPDGARLTEDNVVEELLNRTYFDFDDNAVQDARFQAVAVAVFQGATAGGGSPLELAKGLGRAAGEGRFLVHSFDEGVQEKLSGTRVAGELTTTEADVPEVDIALSDLTGSKMSYYLRYTTDVRADGCADGVQSLAGTMRIGSDLSDQDVSTLPAFISGGGRFGTEPGSQLVSIRIFGPEGGSFDRVRMDGEVITYTERTLDGRAVVELVSLLRPTDDVDITWTMTSGPGQTGDVDLAVTPSIVPGDKGQTSPTACRQR